MKPPTALRTLHVEDDGDHAELIARRLADAGLPLAITRCTSREDFERALRKGGPWDMLITDYRLPDADGMRIIESARSLAPGLPILVVTGEIPEAAVIELLQLGATDYVVKHRLERLVPVVTRIARERAEAHARWADVTAALQELELHVALLVGDSPIDPSRLAKVQDIVRQVRARLQPL